MHSTTTPRPVDIILAESREARKRYAKTFAEIDRLVAELNALTGKAT